MASPDGLVLDITVYVGKGTVPEDDMLEIGLGGSIVMNLLQTLGRSEQMFLFTDTYFTGMKTAEYLIKHNVSITGPIMANGGVATHLPQD